jgi:hypothetical protein
MAYPFLQHIIRPPVHLYVLLIFFLFNQTDDRPLDHDPTVDATLGSVLAILDASTIAYHNVSQLVPFVIGATSVDTLTSRRVHFGLVFGESCHHVKLMNRLFGN